MNEKNEKNKTDNRDSIKFTYYSDDGHGWLKVPIKVIAKLGIANKISSYSYYNNGCVYLEEDNDMIIFQSQCEKVNYKFRVEHIYHAGASKIREYKIYRWREVLNNR